MRKTIISDLDGTISDPTHRLHCIQREPKDWAEFYRLSEDDPAHMDIIDLLWELCGGYNIVIASGRSDEVRIATKAWLNRMDVPCDSLLMRKAGDHRPDHILKAEWADAERWTPESVFFVLEDRSRVVQMWRERGLRVLQVANGDF